MKERLLIVDDSKLIRATTKMIFNDYYEVLEATSGHEALKIIDETIDIVLLDLYMPDMDGLEVIEKIKSDSRICHVPIIIITSSEGVDDQVKAFEMGVNDYITKPFVSEIAVHRVRNVVESNKRMIKVMNEQKLLIIKSELDGLTGVYNKVTSEIKIEENLKKAQNERHALFIFDIDYFKAVNDNEGHLVGDHTLKVVADLITNNFRSTDVVGRIGGDEFIALMMDLKEETMAENKADDLVRLINQKANLNIPDAVTLSIGIAFTDAKCNDYRTLFKRADAALYFAKKNGRNRYQKYDGSEE